MERFYIPVRNVMTTQTELVDGLATMRDAVNLMKAKNIRYAIRLLSRYGETRAIVTDDGQAVGFVTLADMVLHYIEALDT
jgi:CBS domain-containing protein